MEHKTHTSTNTRMTQGFDLCFLSSDSGSLSSWSARTLSSDKVGFLASRCLFDSSAISACNFFGSDSCFSFLTNSSDSVGFGWCFVKLCTTEIVCIGTGLKMLDWPEDVRLFTSPELFLPWQWPSSTVNDTLSQWIDLVKNGEMKRLTAVYYYSTSYRPKSLEA